MDDDSTVDTRARGREAAREVRDTSRETTRETIRASRTTALDGPAFDPMDYVAGALVLVMIWGPLLAGAIRA